MSQNQTRNGLLPRAEEEVPLTMFSNDEKYSYIEYQREIRPPIELLLLNTNAQNEDCDCECQSEFMADMPTNESYTISDEEEQREADNAIKFLTETGMLTKIDEREHFDLNFRSDSSNLGDIDSFSKVSHKHKEDVFDNFRLFEDPFEDDEFNPAETLEKQLQKDPLPEPIMLDVCMSEKLSHAAFESVPDIELSPKPSENNNMDPIFFMTIDNDDKPTVDTNEKPWRDENQNPKANKKKLTEFGYLLQRKGFRLMRKYYKEKFEEFAQKFEYKKRVKQITPGELNQIWVQFILKEFATILPLLSQNEFTDLLEGMKRVVLSDRANKNELMTKNIDFNVVRNLFGKYTQKNMKVFMKEASHSFLYTHFYLINGRCACFEQKDVDQMNLNCQMKKLMLEAFRNLFVSVKPLYEKLYESNAGKL